MVWTRRLVCGVGVNDAEYSVEKFSQSGRWRCPFYLSWSSMLQRCYSIKYQSRNPRYIGCSVCEEWLVFSNFKLWMESQDWAGKQLDKDLLFEGNKVYSPETCVFISLSLNSFLIARRDGKSSSFAGVSFDKGSNKFKAMCSNQITGKHEHIGLFIHEIEAHLAWKKRKHELACQLADLQTDERVANALRARYI